MKFKSLSFIAIIGIFFLCSSSTFTDNLSDSNGMDKETLLMKIIINGLSQNHYQPQKIDNDFSKKVFDLYLERLDYSKRFFLQSDVDKLTKYKLDIDNAITKRRVDYAFLDLSVDLLEQRIKEAEHYYKEVLDKPFAFDKDEMYEVDAEKRGFVSTKEQLKERWRKSLKYQTLTRLVDALESQEKKIEEKKKDFTPKTFSELEKEAREKVQKTHKDWFSRMFEEDRSDRLHTFINAISRAYDPHTNYLPPKEKENFDISLSGRLEGIGARLQKKDGYITVTEIVPGSASARQGQLEAEDIILKVAQGDKEPVDVQDMRLDDAVQLIRGKKGTEVRLTVKKMDGASMVIPIIRDVVLLEESYAKSSILIDEADGSEIGYIKLPKFYADFNRRNGRSCAKDVRKELTKLQQEDVCGVILDLRNNGGGSLRDVVEMAGLFIEDGPIVQVKGKIGSPDVFDDSDPKIHYDGPLVVMVNSFSASASEILAAAIQDYKRGVIVGSAATYGKGTVQRFIHLDQALNPQFNSYKPLGSVKLTIQKFYRINGSTNQLKGVIPDVVLPDNYTYIEVGEKEQEYAMKADKIDALNYNEWTNLGTLDNIKVKSQSRVKSNETFALIEENAKRLQTQRDETMRTLCLDKYRKQQNKLNEESKKYKEIDKEIEDLNARSLLADLAEIRQDTAKESRNKKWLEDITKDVYISESMSIIKDITSGGCAVNNIAMPGKATTKPGSEVAPDPAMLEHQKESNN